MDKERKYIPLVVTSKKARKAVEKHRKFLAETKDKIQKKKELVEYKKSNPPPTIHSYMAMRGMPTNFTARAKFAKTLGIHHYAGTKDQDIKLHALATGKDEYMKEHPEKEKSPLEEYLEQHG